MPLAHWLAWLLLCAVLGAVLVTSPGHSGSSGRQLLAVKAGWDSVCGRVLLLGRPVLAAFQGFLHLGHIRLLLHGG